MYTLAPDQVHWPIAAFLIFMTIFIIAALRSYFMKRDEVETLSNLVFQSDDKCPKAE